jgi:ribonuclease HII
MLTPPPPNKVSRKNPPESSSLLAENPGLRAASGAHIGVDEAGRGCLAGPVVAAAVLFPEQFAFTEHLPGLADSKKLNENQRTNLTGLIMRSSLAYGFGLAWQDEIDRVNILHATLLSMARAVLALAARQQDAEKVNRPTLPLPLPCLVIDGNQTIHPLHWQSCTKGVSTAALAWEQYLPRSLTLLPSVIPVLPEQYAVTSGDVLVPSISAASILAKTIRDGIMSRLDSVYPGYGLARHKGYGTREHLDQLTAKGPCRLHRRSFRHVVPEEEQYRLL